MAYEVEILSPAYDFIQTLDIKMRAKTLSTIELLKQFGPFLTKPHVKKLKSIKNLCELRVKQSSNICRLFFFHYQDTIYVITSGYIKKDRKTSKNEIQKAEKIMTQFLEDKNE